MDVLIGPCHVVIALDEVAASARRLLRVHTLRAFDALQLAAASHWAEGHAYGRLLHTFDARLGAAARREGFIVPD